MVGGTTEVAPFHKRQVMEGLTPAGLEFLGCGLSMAPFRASLPGDFLLIILRYGLDVVTTSCSRQRSPVLSADAGAEALVQLIVEWPS